MSENDETMLFQPRRCQFLRTTSVVFSTSLLVIWWLRKQVLLVIEIRIQTWRWTGLWHMLKVTTTGNLTESRANALLILWQLFQMVCRVTFNSSVDLHFSWSYGTFPTCATGSSPVTLSMSHQTVGNT